MVRRKKSQATKGSIAGTSIKPVILGFNLLVGVAEPSEEPGVMSRGFATPSRCLSFLISKMGTIVLAGGLRSRVKEGVKDTVLSAALHTDTALKETKTKHKSIFMVTAMLPTSWSLTMCQTLDSSFHICFVHLIHTKIPRGRNYPHFTEVETER